MDASKLKQISRSISRQFDKWDYKKAIKLSDSEAATRDYLIEPFFEIYFESFFDLLNFN